MQTIPHTEPLVSNDRWYLNHLLFSKQNVFDLVYIQTGDPMNVER